MLDKKNDLLIAAHKVFLEKGYKSTNISEITKEAGMAVGSFYKYYKSKEELFLEIYIRENEKRNLKLINTIDWNREAIVVIDDIFIFERLEKEAFERETIDKIIKVLDLIYYMDCLITTKDFEDY